MKIKAIFLTVIMLVLILSLVGCETKISRDEAKGTIEAFLEAVEIGDFEAAKTYLHPEKPYDVEKFFNSVEERAGVDFQKGIEIKRYTGFSTSLYDSEIDGSDYELDMDIIVDIFALELSIEVVRNDAGYGIYEIDFDY